MEKAKNLSETNLFYIRSRRSYFDLPPLNSTGKFARIKSVLLIFFFVYLFYGLALRANFGLNLSRDRLFAKVCFACYGLGKIAKKHCRLSFLPSVKRLNLVPVLDWTRILSKR